MTNGIYTCHNLYKFDSKSEKDFAIILEETMNAEISKWLRPAGKQFHIYWKHNSKKYHPDFVVETTDTIYLVEIKKETDIDTAEVQEKAKAALRYCKSATDFTLKNDGKPWKYLLIPHNEVSLNKSFKFFTLKFEYNCEI